jgi:hypothetical protein
VTDRDGMYVVTAKGAMSFRMDYRLSGRRETIYLGNMDDRVTYSVVEQAKQEGLPLEPFTVHDLRRTGS